MGKIDEGRIDVIVPAYNVDDSILFRCLSSIACQDVVEDVKVTVVDDASERENYDGVASCFSMLMDVSVERLTENCGPGVARQHGVDCTSGEYIVFVDADDTLCGSLALKALRNSMSAGGRKCSMVSSSFSEMHERSIPEDQKPGPLLMEHQGDMIWVFGKMYRREFIERNGIRFHPTSRANEDNGFNQLVKLVSTPENPVNFISACTYIWHESEGSITRANNCQYSYGSSIRDSFGGYCENMAYAVAEARKRNPYNGDVSRFAVDCMLNIYEYYIECVHRAPEHAAGNMAHAASYYWSAFRDIRQNIPDNVLAEQYNAVMRNAYAGDKLSGIIPSVGVYEFLDALENAHDDASKRH